MYQTDTSITNWNLDWAG